MKSTRLVLFGLISLISVSAIASFLWFKHRDPRSRQLVIIEAPSNLGLRPLRENHEPGAWRAPRAYSIAGLQQALHPSRIVTLAKPTYDFNAQPGTRLRNGRIVRSFSEKIADAVASSLRAHEFPVVIGGDCSILIGSFAGVRRVTDAGLVHIDGHSDFRHPGNYDPMSFLGTVAGMDLALVTGRGEELLTKWDGRAPPLVIDQHVVQIGEKTNTAPDFASTSIKRLNLAWVNEYGATAAAEEAIRHLKREGARRFWVHVDVDVLNSAIMPAVDSPENIGLTYDQLGLLLYDLCSDTGCLGVNISIFDPELDPNGVYAKELTSMFLKGLKPRIREL